MASSLTRRSRYVLKDSSILALKYPQQLGPADMGTGNPVYERVVNMGMDLELREVISLTHLAMVLSSNCTL